MPKEKKPLKIAVIGCGINGISCALSLAERGHTIYIYEKKLRSMSESIDQFY